MPYKGIVKGNVIVLEEQADLKEGTKVEVIPLDSSKTTDTVCGSWKDNRPAEEIVKEIRSSRLSRDKEISL